MCLNILLLLSLQQHSDLTFMNMIKYQNEARAVLRKLEAHTEPNILFFQNHGF